MTWDPQQYLRFDAPRLRPALELLARIPLDEPEVVVDLGCGAGNVTSLLAARWPGARIIGVDNDPAMLEMAAATVPDVELVDADADRWEPPDPPDVVYSNAVLHWLDDHALLLPRLLGWLRPGGVLAVQMPRPDDQPSHLALRDVAADARWAERLLPLLRRGAVAAPEDYYDLLAPIARSVDVWATTYVQVLTGEDPVTEWIKGSAMRPLLAALDEEEQAAFVSAYRERAQAEYPTRPSGVTLLPYTRVFVVAVAR